jgi:hypothetical protein
MTTPTMTAHPDNPSEWEAFREEIISGSLDDWKISEIDLISGIEEHMTGRTLRRRFEDHAADMAVSSMLARVASLMQTTSERNLKARAIRLGYRLRRRGKDYSLTSGDGAESGGSIGAMRRHLDVIEYKLPTFIKHIFSKRFLL